MAPKKEAKDEKAQESPAKPKRVKKEYDMPGQTRELDPAAPEAESLRLFYTTLKEQRPDSEIAPVWLMQHGLLEREEAEAVFEKVAAARAKARAAGAPKSSSNTKKGERKPDPRRKGGAKGAAAKAKGKKPAAPRKRSLAKAKPVIHDDDDDDDDDFVEPAAKKAKPATKVPAKRPPAKGAGAKKPAVIKGKPTIGKGSVSIVDDDDDDD